MPEKPKLKTVFEYEGLQFRLKNPSLLYRSQGDEYQRDVLKFVNEFTDESKQRLLKIIPEALNELDAMKNDIDKLNNTDINELSNLAAELLNAGKLKEFDEVMKDLQERLKGKSMKLSTTIFQFFDSYTSFQNDLLTAEELWFSKIENVIRLFSIALDGPLDKINYDPDTNEKIIAFDGFLEEVSNNFFMSLKYLKKKSRR